MTPDRGDRGLDPRNPFVWILLAPQRMRARKVELRRSFGNHPLVQVDKQRLYRRRTNVEPQKCPFLALSHRRLPLAAIINKKPRLCRRGSSTRGQPRKPEKRVRRP